MKTNDLKKIIELFAPINDAISIIEKVATLEQAENEAIQRIDELRKEAAKLEANNKNAQTIAEGLINEASARATALGEAADAEMVMTKDKAASILADAHSKVQALTEEAEAKCKALQSDAVAAAERTAAANKELAELEAKIEKAKAQIAKMLGGN